MTHQEALDRFLFAIKHIPNKNYGGCLFFVYLYWKWLKLNNVSTNEFKIVQYAYIGDSCIQYNLNWDVKNIDHPEKHAKSSSHFAWMFDGKDYDAEGLVKEKFLNTNIFDRVILPFTDDMIEPFCISALIFASWNNMFNRYHAFQVADQLQLNLDNYFNVSASYDKHF